MSALGELGLADIVRARSHNPRSGEVRRLDGTVLKCGELPAGVQHGPMVIALRPALHGVLLEAMGPDVISLGRVASGFTTVGKRVSLQFTGGSTVEGDILIGADGVRSAIRQALHPDEPAARPSGLVAVRGVVHGAVHHLGKRSAVLYLGRGVEAALARAGETGIYWYLSLAAALLPSGLNDPAAILQLMLPRFDQTFRAIASTTADLRYDALVDRDPLPYWGRGSVTLLGDAAHPLLPQTGQGAAQAMVDAVALARSLERIEDVEVALRTYEHERLGPTADWVQRGRRAARIMGTLNPVACAFREVTIRLIPSRTAIALYSWFKQDSSTVQSR